MLINIPIEPIEERYSIDWDNWFSQTFKHYKIPFITIYGSCLTEKIEEGRFLDCIGTNYYKSSQLLQILSKIYTKEIISGDVLFFHDLWFPGIEQIKYVANTMNLDIKITGCLHAGCYDPNDFLYQANTGNWAVHFEHMLFALSDLIFVATAYHKNLIQKSRSVDLNKIKVTGFPIVPQLNFKNLIKNNTIVFPHRLDIEKNPHYFKESIERLPSKIKKGWNFILTKEKQTNKKDYYKILHESKISVSFADQETWGIAMIESVFAGCLPLVPNKLSYKELYFFDFRYTSPLDFENKLISFMTEPLKHETLLQKQKDFLLKLGMSAIPNMLAELRKLNFI